MRTSSITRTTKETDIKLDLNIDGKGTSIVDTKIGFFDHMLNALAVHGHLDLTLKAIGDLHVDTHHTVEDVGIVLGQALNEAVGDKVGINRYSNFVMPMDDALVLCALDISNRGYFCLDYKFNTEKVGEFETETLVEFFQALANNFKVNLHFIVLRGENTHHIIEAIFKSFAKCLYEATRIKDNQILSSKGVL